MKLKVATLTVSTGAILSRQVAGVRGSTLIMNLPGSPAGVRECLDIVGDALEHACDVVRGRAHDCGRG